MLLERPGDVVSREELRQRLWPEDVFVDFDHGLNKSVQKLRDALGDSAGSSRYIETIPRVGYRFIAPVDRKVSQPEPKTELDRPSPTDEDAISAPREFPPQSLAPTPALSEKYIWKWVAAAISILAIAGVAWQAQRPYYAGSPIRSVAVLPLDNLSGDPGQEYFADGMTDELTTMLAKNSTLRVISRTSAMQYKGVHKPLPEIARELGVDAILEGSIARTGNQMHMTIQLIQAPTDTHLWAESYDRNANDAVSLPREAAQAIAKQLKSVAPRIGQQRYISPEAHDAYLRGRYIWFTGSNEEAGKYFKEAVELQPDYALGWSGLADYYCLGPVVGYVNPQTPLASAEAAAVKAISLDDSLPEAHLSMSAVFFYSHWDWPRAEGEIARAMELEPKLAVAYHLHAKILAALNRQQEAIAAQQKAMELDPFIQPWAMASALSEARLYDAAISDLQQRLGIKIGLTHSWTHSILADIYRRKGALKEAAEESEKASLLSGDKGSAENVRRAFEKGGYQAVLLLQLSDLKQKSAKHYVSPVDMALLYAQLGQREKTLTLLEQGYREHSPLLLPIQNDPAYDFLHTDERYRAIIRNMGLPPAY